jgi:acetyl esterase/lipase
MKPKLKSTLKLNGALLWAGVCLFISGFVSPLALAQSITSSSPSPSPGPGASDSPLPASAFYGPWDIEGTALSPSGRWLAISTGKLGNRVALLVFDLKNWVMVGSVAQFSNADIDSFHWVGDDRLVFDLIDKKSGGGDQRWWPGLFSVGRDGKDLRKWVNLEGSTVEGPNTMVVPLAPNHFLLHVPESGDEVVVGQFHYDGNGEFDTIKPKRLNLATRRAEALSTGAPGHVRRWLFDPKGEPRVAVTQYRGSGAVHWRAPGQTAWRKLADYPIHDAPFTVEFADDKGGLWVKQSLGKDGFKVLKRFDFETGQPENEPLVSTPGFDFAGHIVSESAGSKALGVRFSVDAEDTVWFDPGMKALQAEADQRFPGLINRLACRRCAQADRVVVSHSYSDRDPGQIWVHKADTNTWRKVGDSRSVVPVARMSSVQFHRVPARDGLPIPVWVTLPKPQTTPAEAAAGPVGRAVSKPPAVVLVHGGPWVRGGYWRWDADVQFLASRGYAVIQPEFRGSVGFGEAHFRAGWRQWGRAMQDDIADALKWAVAKGLVDGNRVCIAGASYGGYATLMGLARDPELYRCGAAWMAVTDPRLLFKWSGQGGFSSEAREHDYPVLIGDPDKDATLLDRVSPVLLAQQIKAPVFLAHGGEDRRVPLKHGKRMRDALAEVGREPRWVVYPDEGHGWLKFETQLDFAKRLEDFLATHLK